ncbi:CKLF-like MARVEL transmembrane domain-containing protein 8 isoform 2-T2 [Liasis olivaceus]
MEQPPHESHPHQERARSHTVTTTSSSFATTFSSSSSTLAYDREFLKTIPGVLMVTEIVLGFLVWILIAGTEYFLYPVFGWIMFVAVFYWILTLFFLIIYMTMAYTRIPQVPWTTVKHVQSPKNLTARVTIVGQHLRSLPSLSLPAMVEIHILVLYLGDHGPCNKYYILIKEQLCM